MYLQKEYRRSDIINKKLKVLKDLLSMFIAQQRNKLSYIIGFLSALAFALVYINYGLQLAVPVLVIGILLFEIFDYFFGGTPDIIVMGVDSEEDMLKTLRKNVSKAIKEEKNSNSNKNKDN